ncbi:Methylglyoxal reductase (NADPH-dependent) [Paenibacillus curdlanolyticus YK9]|uniref:Methylglyoxal reductase (NADPH-dependent) n=1 Tax=Paenibacillus curdlanolyticus YK9 TaxID=717606 RepID=E0IEM7_9BACL|nr:aldo/keto reductase [Paenibacillus curdlanolyticus]EFM09115.1 Methylglyoxal reductase (NADPH-dependent) [Paenibacillus curdlanolyticus YK9]
MSVAKHIADTVELANGVTMPWLGLGVWQAADGAEVETAVRAAIEAGYRSIDTAAVYGNEEGVGRAIRETGVKRDELFITTKVWNADQGYESTLQAFETSRRKLGLDVIDLYLVHWPVTGKYKETYRALEKLYRDGSIRAIGVSNFLEPQLHDLLGECEVKPMVNQVEFHPLLTQPSLYSLCKEHGIRLEAWSPLMQGNLDLPLLRQLADKYGKSPAQIVLRWDLQRGVITIPKSVTPARIAENANVFDFNLSDADVAALDALDEGRRFGPDPMTFV